MNRMPVDDAGLRRRCGSPLPDEGRGRHADAIIEWLGEPLARAWLRKHVIEAAEAGRAALYGEAIPSQPASPPRDAMPGRCRLLLVTKASEKFPLLRPALVLPVDWRRIAAAGPSSSRLPRGLAAFADAVLADLKLSGLSLHLPREYDEAGVDLSSLSVSLDSAWAALAAGAVVASGDGVTMPEVMATAAWSRASQQDTKGWIRSVEGIPAKLDAAIEAGAKVVFVPRADEAAVSVWRAGGATLDVRFLSNAEMEPRAAIAALLEVLEVPPTRAAGDSFERCCDYYTRMPERQADAYYRSELLEEAAMRMRVPDDPRLREVRKLAFIAGRSLAVPFLLTRRFDPDQVLILHDGQLKGDEPAICERDLRSLGRDGLPDRIVRVKECDPKSLADDVARHVTTFEAEFPRGRLLADLTPGYRAFNLALLGATPATGLRAFIHSDQTQGAAGSRVRPGNEHLRLFDLPG